MALQGNRLFLTTCGGTALSMLTYGWDAGVLGGILQTSAFQSSMGFPDATIISMITSVFLLGSWLGCILMSIFGMTQGRKTWLLYGNALSVVGTIISASSYGYGQLIAGRLILGIGNGLITSMGPIYVAEMAVDKRQRGRAVNAMIASATCGTALAYWVDFGMVFTHGQVVWRFPVAFQAFFSFASVSTLWWLPDTPRWYYAKGREVEGDSVLERLHDLSIAEVQEDKREISASLELEHFEKSSLRLKDFFWDTSDMQSARRIRTSMIIYALTYLSGLDFIFYYTTTIFEVYIGLQPLTASGLAGLATTLLCLFAWLSCWLVERVGRRTWLLGGAIGQTLFICPFVALLAHRGPKTGAAAAAMLFCYVCVNAATWAPFSSVYSSEIMPLRYRHVGFSLGISCQWLFAFVTVFAGPIGEATVGWKILTWFLCFNVLSILYVYFFCPETRGKTLEEMDLVFMSAQLKATAAGQLLEHQGNEMMIGNQDVVEEKGAVSHFE